MLEFLAAGSGKCKRLLGNHIVCSTSVQREFSRTLAKRPNGWMCLIEVDEEEERKGRGKGVD